MILKILSSFRGILVFLLCVVNLIVCSFILYFLGFIKLLMWKSFWDHSLQKIIDKLIVIWIKTNSLFMRLFIPTVIDMQGNLDFSGDHSYLLVANHQSWIDVLLLERIFVDKLPAMKFFMKKELFWVPFLGLACKIAGFPFMRRYTQEYLQRNPKKYGKDLETARMACEKFKKTPATIVTFSEGTRFRAEKWKKQQSPYTHLLRPRAGGIALVINVMGDGLQEIVDVTLCYPVEKISLWDFFKGQYPVVRVVIEKRPIPANLRGDYNGDPVFRIFFQNWLNACWQEKDKILKALKGELQ